ncbi:MAG: alkaline phosphatase D family protein [Prosthecobacter sp.]|nr:alkaline phosphatase D family protein [Prosthecobacter sp.]
MPTSRRQFLAESSALAATSLMPLAAGAESPAPLFQSRWQDDLDRVWLGADFWANPLQDWQVRGGRAECIAAKPNRNVHVLTCELADRKGSLGMSVTVGRLGGGAFRADGKGSAGFKIGILGTLRDEPKLRDYRNNLAFSSGWDVGIRADGGLFFGDARQPQAKAILDGVESVRLELQVQDHGATYWLKLTAHDAKDGRLLGELLKDDLRANQLIGNLAIGCNFGPEGPRPNAKKKAADREGGAPGNGLFWFADWTIAGSKVDVNESHRFGPILFNHYTLSGGVMKMTAQMPPLGADDSPEVRLEIQDGEVWKVIATAQIHALARTATFRITDWDVGQDVRYRLTYVLKTRDGTHTHHWAGTVRRDPTGQDEIKVADVSCNIHTAFPNAPYVAAVAKLDPDLLAFVGDQFYESTAGYGVQRTPLEPAALDYLRKWYFHGWTWRELTKDRPSVSLPDDHDVYQGNLWGVGGEKQTKSQEAGGYEMMPEWVNLVHRTQTAHHPDPYDPRPCKQGITNYYGAMTYGGISFAILADRQYKSAPEGNVPPTDERPDHMINPDADPKLSDIDGLELLGSGQMRFLEEWVRDWHGAQMKAVISQTIFTGMATTHGGERQVLRMDYDQNGWPQKARNAALRLIRKAHAFHIAGDQHLPAVVHYGIDEPRDAGVAFAGPAVNVGYPRWWEPTEKVNGRKPGQGLTGDFIDHCGHPMAVLAVKNGAHQPPKETMANLREKTSGFGLVRFDKRKRTITCECWPLDDIGGRSMETWPVVTTQRDQYGRQAKAHLPTLRFTDTQTAVVEVIDARSGELIYSVRLNTAEWQPHVFAEGEYNLRLLEPEAGPKAIKELTGLRAQKDNREVIEISLA